MYDNNVCREYTTVDGRKPPDWVEPKLTRVARQGMGARLEVRLIVDGVATPVGALDYGSTSPEAWTWMCDALNLRVGVGETPETISSREKFNKRPNRGPVLPNQMSGRQTV